MLLQGNAKKIYKEYILKKNSLKNNHGKEVFFFFFNTRENQIYSNSLFLTDLPDNRDTWTRLKNTK